MVLEGETDRFKVEMLEALRDALKKERDEAREERDALKQAAINAGHALCALVKDEPSDLEKSIVDRQIKALTKLTGHNFHWRGEP